jgi:hypothetical protein
MKQIFGRLLLILVIVVFTNAQVIEDVIGMSAGSIVASSSGVTTTAWVDTMWFENVGRTVDHVRLFVQAVTGSPVAGDQTIEIQPDSSGAPSGTPITNGTLTTATTPAANIIVDFSPSGTHPVLSNATQYHLVAKNATGSTTVTYRLLQNTPPMFESSPNNLAGYGCQTSANSGSTWAACGSQGITYFRIDFSNGDHRGIPIENTTLGTASLTANEKLFNGKLIAMNFTTANVTGLQPNVTGVSCFVKKVGNPTGNLTGVLYKDNGTDISAVTGGSATTTYTPSQIAASGGQTIFKFASAVTLSPNTIYKFAFSNSQTDTSSNYYYLTHYQINTDATDLAMMPFAGTLRQAYCTASCTSTGQSANWTIDTNGSITPVPICYLTLSTTTPYAPAAAGNSGFSFGRAK